MRLIRFTRSGGTATLGLAIDGRAVALAELIPDAPTEARAAIAAWEDLGPRLAAADATGKGLPLDQVALLSPLEATEKMMALGLNYADHLEEAKDQGLKIPTEQVWFCKQPGALNGPFAGIELPKASEKLDYEVELVAVIGKAGRHIHAEDAHAHVFGYAVGNDVSARDW